MSRSIHLILLFFACSALLPAQSFEFPEARERLFPISAKRADSLLGLELASASLPELGLALSIGTDPETLPNGHYVSVKIEKEEMTWAYFQRHDYEVQVSQNKGKFNLRLYDTLGTERTDATVLADKKLVRYHKASRAYVRRDWRIDRLTVTIDRDTLFYTIDESISGSRLSAGWKRVSRSQVARTILLPYTAGRKTYRYFKRGFGYGDWTWYDYPLQRTIQRVKYPEPIVGYITSSQPKYKPEDTLRVSAYLTRPKGRPLRSDSILVRIYPKHGSYTPVFEKKVARSEKGRYNLTLAIPPEWPLDKNYTLDFSLTGLRWRKIKPKLAFKLEDYELAEYKLTTGIPDDTRLPGSAWVDIKASDVNELPLPDANIKVTVMLERFEKVRDSVASISLPDTLYRYAENTDNRMDRRIVLPDSLFPAGYALKTKVKTQLTGPSGAYKEEVKDLVVDRRYEAIPKIKVVGDSLHLTLAPASAQNDKLIRLQLIGGKKDTTYQLIRLPARIKLDHSLTQYKLDYNGLVALQDMSDLSPVGPEPFTFSRDTFFSNFPNNYGQKFFWELIDDQTGESKTFRKNYSISGLAPGKKVRFQYSYFSAGKWVHKSISLNVPRYDLLTSHKNLLNLTIEQPETVKPGETVSIKLKATDQKGRPAPDVKLSAVTYNARFEDRPATLPTYLSKSAKQRRFQSYKLQAPSLFRKSNLAGWAIKALKLDTTKAYQLRFPQPYFENYRDFDSIMPPKSTAGHFAPFIKQKNSLGTIRAIYANDRLVYLHHANFTTPYTIELDSGQQEITLRTDGASYKKTITVRPRQQLITSFNSNNSAEAGWHKTERNKWTQSEIDIIKRKVFALTQMRIKKPIYFQQWENAPIQSVRGAWNEEWTPLGIANLFDVVKIWLPTGETVKVPFESGALYRITPSRDRLYPFPEELVRKHLTRKARSAQAYPGHPRYTVPTSINKHSIDDYYFTSLPRLIRNQLRSRIQFSNVPDSIKHVLLRQANSSIIYKAHKTTNNLIAPGYYEVIFLTKSNEIQRHQVQLLEPNQTYLVNYNTLELITGKNLSDGLGFTPTLDEAALPKPNFEKYRIRTAYSKKLQGIVVDQEGNPLPFATVQTIPFESGTQANLDGFFELDASPDVQAIQADFTGFAPTKVTFSGGLPYGELITIEMNSGEGLDLSEIMIVGFSKNLPARKKTTRPIITSENFNTANIRGSRAGATDYYVNGVRVDSRGAIPKINILGSSSIETKRQGAPAFLHGIYGISATHLIYYIDGVPFTGEFTPQLEQNLTIDYIEGNILYLKTKVGALENLPAESIRKTFADNAAYLPHLSTDSQGEASFQVTFPDDITAWNTLAIGQDRKRRVAFKNKRTRAFLPIQAQLYLPRFLVEGDSSEALTLAVNRTAEAQTVRLSFREEGVIAGDARDTVLVESLRGSYPIQAGTGKDSLAYTFSLQSLSEPYVNDGEKRDIKVFSQGTEMVSGKLFLLKTEVSELQPSFIDATRGNVTLRLLGNRLEQLLGDLNYITDYPYACTEQTASRLIGLLSKRAINQARNIPTAQEEVGIRKMIRRLEKLQRPDNGYGWWGTSESSTPWISIHVYRALSKAAGAGFNVSDLTPARRYLLGVAPGLRKFDKLQVYLSLAEEGNLPTNEEMERLDTITGDSDFLLLARTRLHQLRGDSIDLDSVLAASSQQFGLGRYWGKRQHYWFFRRPLEDRLQSTLLAHRILATAKLAEADEAVNYLLGQSPNNQRPGSTPLLGTNTLESALLVDALLPTLLTPSGQIEPPTVTASWPGGREKISSFPYTKEMKPAEATKLTLTKEGSGPVPGVLYQRYFEQLPVPTNNGFSLSSRLLDGRDRPLQSLTKGETAWLEVAVTTKADGQYVLIEVPIPAGCSFADRAEPPGFHAVHREYRRDRVAIFCDRLPIGKHKFRVSLQPRFSGEYTLNPARAELQYLPVINGNIELKRVAIE